MANILLIRPQQIHWAEEAKRVASPIGLLSIASYLRMGGHNVNFIDATIEGYNQEREIKPEVFEFGLPQKDLEAKIKGFNPDFVGIQSSLTCYWEQAKNVAKSVKKIKPTIKVVLGGQHASGVSNWILANESSIDYVIVGEGEYAFLELIDNPKQKRGVIIGEPVDMEKLPNPAFDLINPQNYKPEMSHFGKPRGDNFITNIVTRGCPSACDFCTSSHYFGRNVRHYSLEQIAQQINELKKMGFEEYVSQDDNILTLPPKFRKEFFKLLKDSGIHWNLDGGLYYSKVTPKLIDELVENGCYRVFLPIENPNLNLMHEHNKYRNLKTTEDQKKKLNEIIENLNNVGIEFYSAIMIGFPKESWQSVRKAINYGRELKDKSALGVGFHWVHPYPFSPFYDKNYSLVPNDRKWENAPEFYTFVKPVFPIEGISLNEAEQYVNEQSKRINGTNTLNNSWMYRLNN